MTKNNSMRTCCHFPLLLPLRKFSVWRARPRRSDCGCSCGCGHSHGCGHDCVCGCGCGCGCGCCDGDCDVVVSSSGGKHRNNSVPEHVRTRYTAVARSPILSFWLTPFTHCGHESPVIVGTAKYSTLILYRCLPLR